MTYKSALRIFVPAPKMPFLGTQKWALLPDCPLLGTKKWHFECPNKNSESTFISQTSPKNDGIDFSFMRLPLLDGFLAISKYAKLRKLFQKGCLGPK